MRLCGGKEICSIHRANDVKSWNWVQGLSATQVHGLKHCATLTSLSVKTPTSKAFWEEIAMIFVTWPSTVPGTQGAFGNSVVVFLFFGFLYGEKGDMQHSPDQWVEASAARSEVGRVSKEAFLPHSAPTTTLCSNYHHFNFWSLVLMGSQRNSDHHPNPQHSPTSTHPLLG